ncbi:MAG: 1-phosphofructokinase [Solobacterium sp.]|nr:1-phosphofructokinase [Solobacterium sp.]
MIYTVTFNPSLDYIVTVDHFKAGQINRTADELIYPGGKGINVSIVLKNLGFENTALGFMAGFTGKEIQRLLEEMGVSTDFIHVANGTSRINLKMRSDQETEINGRGPVIGDDDIRKLYTQLDDLKAGDILALSGSIPSSMPETIYMDIMQYLEGKGIEVAVDATRDLLVKVLPYHPFVIKPNNHELGEIFQTEITSKDDVIRYAHKLQEMGARNVLVSMAGEGAVLVTENGEEYRASAPKGILKNSVGAGDSMVAGFLAGYLKNHDYREAFRMGVCTGSASAFSDALATKEEVETLIIRSTDCFEMGA